MKITILTVQHLAAFRARLLREEKSKATVEKYCRDAQAYYCFVRGKSLSKDLTIAYKKRLEEQGYAVASINSMLVSANSLLEYLERPDCRVTTIRVQRKAYCGEKQQLTREEYLRLLAAAERRPRLRLILQTICGTGIRVSELKYFTVEAARLGEVSVHSKRKVRVILIPGKLRKLLLQYAKKAGIAAGGIFITRGGKPLDRSNIWAGMKKLCAAARVDPEKVFPHNLRKLFARTFYQADKDIAKLADVLGHGNIETTRIYIMTTGQEHRRRIEGLGLIL